MKNACIVVKKCIRIMILMTFFEIYVLFARFLTFVLRQVDGTVCYAPKFPLSVFAMSEQTLFF